MSINVTTTTSPPVLQHKPDLSTESNRSLQSSASQAERSLVSRYSLRVASKKQYYEPPPSRNRIMSASEDTSGDVVPELKDFHFSGSKFEKRNSDLKSPFHRSDITLAGDRRNSNPQFPSTTTLPNPFRMIKQYSIQNQHSKTNVKEETYTTHLTNSNVNVRANTSSLPVKDRLTTKADLSFTLKSSTMNNSNPFGLVSSNIPERSVISRSEDPTVIPVFILDKSSTEPQSTELLLSQSQAALCLSKMYRDHFFDYFHINYHGQSDDAGPFIVSIRYYYPTVVDNACYAARALIRTANRNYDLSHSIDEINEDKVVHNLFQEANLTNITDFGAIGDPKANEKIYEFDKKCDEQHNYKIGVVYQRANQSDEYVIFRNDHISDEMSDFFNKISTRVHLKGFEKYRADLDVNNDLHGDYSYFTDYENHEIMFNIAPFIPMSKADGQCIQRKSLVCNAFVCIVFQEPGAVLIPDRIYGKVTHVFITVEPMKIDKQLYYKIGIWRRNDMKSVVGSAGGIYKSDEFFRSYFLTLLLNSMTAAIESANLRKTVYEPRQQLKLSKLNDLVHIFYLSPIDGFNTHVDNVDTRSNARSESFATNTTVTTNDSGSTTTNPDRISPVSSKKWTFSKKILGVFSSRSASIPSSTVPSIQINNDGSTMNLSSTSDTTMTLGRFKEPLKRSKSPKPHPAPMMHIGSTSPPSNVAVVVQPAISSVQLPNPSIPTVDQNQSSGASTTDESTSSCRTDEDDDTDESSSDDDKLPCRPLVNSSTPIHS